MVYKVPELKNDEFLKISLRSLDSEDTTPISQVHLSPEQFYFSNKTENEKEKGTYSNRIFLHILI